MSVVDYYEILGVDRQADAATIREALRKNQPIWSSGTRNPKTKHRFQSYLDLIPEIQRSLLGDLAARAGYDATLLSQVKAERSVKLDELQRWVRLRGAKGGLNRADRDLLADRAAELGLGASDLGPLVAPYAEWPDEPSATARVVEPPPDVLDLVTRKQIAVALDHLRKRDLYDLLGVTRDASNVEIRSMAEARRKEWLQKSQVTAEKTAWLEAVSQAVANLNTAEARARYDRTLKAEAEERFGSAVTFAVRGLARLDYGTRSELIREAAADGIDAERAETLIGRACRPLGVSFELPAALMATNPLDPPRFLRCRACSGVSNLSDLESPGRKPDADVPCPHCGASLRWQCPSCRRSHWVDVPRCGCGFAREDVEPLARHLADARASFDARDDAAALDSLNHVLRYLPQHAGALKGIKAIRKRQGRAEAARADCELARNRRRLVEALGLARAWAQLVPVDDLEAGRAVSEALEGLREARKLVDEAERAMHLEPTRARGLLDRALSIAADLPEASAARLRCPPEPPRNLVVSLDGERIGLRWEPSGVVEAEPVRFRVVRKRGAPPSELADGLIVAELDETEWSDASARPGEVVGYAVYAVKGDVASATAAASSTVRFSPDVEDFHAEPRDASAALSWTLPRWSVGVRVVRSDRQRPKHPDDGEILVAGPSGLIDEGLANDLTYHYAVFAEYRAADGSESWSPGRSASVTPRPPVGAVGPVDLVATPDGRVSIHWPAPPRGTVRIFRSAREVPLSAGDRLPLSGTSGWSGEWFRPVAPGLAEDPDPPSMGFCVYTPILVDGAEAVVGHASRFSCVPDPTDLRASRVGGVGPDGSIRVHLRWRWGPQGVESRVVARRGAPPEAADDPLGLGFSVIDDEYGRLGFLAIDLPGPTETERGLPWHLAVFAVARAQGSDVTSPGIVPGCRAVVAGHAPEVTVSYRVGRGGLAGRTWTLTLQATPAGSSIPPTALIVNPRTVPLSADDGAIVARFPATGDGASYPVSPQVGASLRAHRGRLFVDPEADPTGLAPVRFLHPGSAEGRA